MAAGTAVHSWCPPCQLSGGAQLRQITPPLAAEPSLPPRSCSHPLTAPPRQLACPSAVAPSEPSIQPRAAWGPYLRRVCSPSSARPPGHPF